MLERAVASGSHSQIYVLVVEDSPGDAKLIEMAFDRGRTRPRLYIVEDGVEALDFLHREGKYANCPRPHLVLLDLNLPRKSGLEVLSEIKRDPHLKVIPTVVLTTSDDELEILRCYQHHANCYLVKPTSFQKFCHAIACVEALWLDAAKLPN
ncbi:response regulator [Leptolyngbya valderiana BDU 20041]|nr:response regulator [Geitlerinema sp. CS-897]OAB62220.1 response regulator [Leptolyngbya valderiana BDU 20041]PPT06255.1 Two-component system response regulator [Geitlerinema sp. FC II]